MPLHDSYGRTVNYLRLSVTDRCNLRCTYCMPAKGIHAIHHTNILSYEELLQVAEAAVAIGVEKIRVTGGEPLVRKGIIHFLERLACIPGLQRLVLTTNGTLLPEMAAELRCAGVDGLNISLDSLCPNTFAGITRGGDMHKVLKGIEAAERAGFQQIKINVVVMRGVNDDEIVDFAALTLDRPYRVRFIEYMPTLQDDAWKTRIMTGEEVLERLSRKFELRSAGRETMAGPATYYQIAGAAGMIGVITPISCHFCNDCNRIRVTSTGVAKSCLFSTETCNLRPFINAGDDQALRDALRSVVNGKPKRHDICDSGRHHAILPMSRVGG
jgi:cyclic pyranopterin phosphate synthase